MGMRRLAIEGELVRLDTSDEREATAAHTLEDAPQDLQHNRGALQM